MEKKTIMNLALSLALLTGVFSVRNHIQKVHAEAGMEKEPAAEEEPAIEEVPAELPSEEEEKKTETAEPEVKEEVSVMEEEPVMSEPVIIQEEPEKENEQPQVTAEGGFQTENGQTYYIDPETGEKLKGLNYIDGDWYFFDEEDGHMITGLVWHKAFNKTYCYDPQTGKRCTGTVLVDGTYYYMNEETFEPCSGFIQEFGKTYYIDEETAIKTKGQAYLDDSWYFFDEKSGEMRTGFQYIKPERKTVYYSANSGKMLKGEQTVGSYRYYFEPETGAMMTGFVTTDTGKRAYFNEEGHMLYGAQVINYNEYYFDPSTGAMHTGFRTANGNTYYYSGSGIKQFGWTTVNGTEYYFNETTGAMATGRTVINGRTYFFESNGRQVDFNDTSSLLVVANKKHRLPVGYVPDNLVIPNVPMNYTMYLKQEAASAMEHMFAAAANAGITLRLGSAYRSEALQNQLYYGYVAQYGQAEADTISSRPGYSDHQTGLAADISDHDGATYLTQSMEYTPEGRWLRDHAHEYGFIMRYPKGKDAITGYSYEPWHFRYIGVEYATAIYNTDVWYSFEEYFGVEGGDYN